MQIPIISDESLSINWNLEYKCKRLVLPLFADNKVSYSDIIQGSIGSCWFLTTLISYLRPSSKEYEERSSDLMDSIKIKRKDANRNIYSIRIDKSNYYVDDYVQVSYYNSYKQDLFPKCLWFVLLEKAMLCHMTRLKDKSSYKQYCNNYYVFGLNVKDGEMNVAAKGINFLVGGNPKYYCLHSKDTKSKKINSYEIYRKFKRGEHILANTHRSTYPGGGFNIKGSPSILGAASSHCYAVLNMEYSKEHNTYMITLCNPWHQKEVSQYNKKFIYPPDVSPGEGVSIITWERFQYLFACVHISGD